MTQMTTIAALQSSFALAGRVRPVQGTLQDAAVSRANGANGAMAADSTDSSSSKNAEKVENSSAASRSADSAAAGASSVSSLAGDQLTVQEQQLVAQLKLTDRLVRAHEQAHLSAGAGLVRGAASFSMQTGPDDRSYAVGGEVSIDTSPASTPQETIAKARQIRAAALAPADPSAQDLHVAALASGMEGEAQVELAAQQRAAAAASRGGDQQRVGFYRDVAQTADATPGAALDVYA